MKVAERGLAFESMLSAPVPEGYLLAGKYRVGRVIGAGGMGVVVAATHIHIGQRVAIKFLLPHATEDEQAMARFAREARALAQIENEHVGRVIDVGVLDGRQPYTVLECLTGQNLAELLKTRGALDVKEAVTYVLQACEAMTEAHALGIIHRDLKPENLFLAERADGSRIIKVIDFGVSKILGNMTVLASADVVTSTSVVIGSPLYMSPEQLRAARDVDVRTDIWSLGVTLYELLTAEGPFRWTTLPELCASILKEPARPLRQLRPAVPEALETVVMRCLEKEPELRISSARELGQELFRCSLTHGAAGSILPSFEPPSRSLPFRPAIRCSPLASASISSAESARRLVHTPPRPAEPPCSIELCQEARPSQRPSCAGANVAPEPSSDHPFEGSMRRSTFTPPIGLSTMPSVPPPSAPSFRPVKVGVLALFALGVFAGALVTGSPATAPTPAPGAPPPQIDGSASARAFSTSAVQARTVPSAAGSTRPATPIVPAASAVPTPSSKEHKPDRAVSTKALKDTKSLSGRPFRPSYPQSAFDHRK